MSRMQISTISEGYGALNEPRTSDTFPLSIYDEPFAITSQPHTGDLNRGPRRPIPINTADWVSTPRSLLNPICSTQFLEGVSQLEIQQTVDLRTLMGDCRNGNHYKYRVKIPRAETLFLATELNDRRIIGSSRGFIVNLQDASGQTAFLMTKTRTWGCVPGFLHKLSVDGTLFVGSIEQDFTLFANQFTVYDELHQPLCRIYSPYTFCDCTYKEERFQVVAMDDDRPLASIVLQWDHQVMDYVVTITFPLAMHVKLKSLLLGAVFLMESLYFERIKKSSIR